MYSDLSAYLNERVLQTTQDMITCDVFIVFAVLSVSERCGNANEDLENLHSFD